MGYHPNIPFSAFLIIFRFYYVINGTKFIPKESCVWWCVMRWHHIKHVVSHVVLYLIIWLFSLCCYLPLLCFFSTFFHFRLPNFDDVMTVNDGCIWCYNITILQVILWCYLNQLWWWFLYNNLFKCIKEHLNVLYAFESY